MKNSAGAARIMKLCRLGAENWGDNAILMAMNPYTSSITIQGSRPKKDSGRQQRFFEKKRAKNFYLLGVVAAPAPPRPFSKSFLLLFFKKEALSFFARLPRITDLFTGHFCAGEVG